MRAIHDHAAPAEAGAAAQRDNRNDGTGSLLCADKRMLTTGGAL
jgi:hypothetical protein